MALLHRPTQWNQFVKSIRYRFGWQPIEAPISTKIETGDSALLFVSTATIPMKERSEVTYNLVDKITVSTLDNSVKNRTIFKGLPISSPEAIMLDNSTVPPLFSSPIYIYI